MGKIADKLKHQRMVAAQDEGLIRVSFSFAGKKYVREHRLNQAEVDAAKRMLAEGGPDAFETVTIKAPIWGCGRFGEYVVTEAMKEYAREHWIPKAEPRVAVQNVSDAVEVTTGEIMEQLAKRQGIVLSPEVQAAVDETGGIVGTTTGRINSDVPEIQQLPGTEEKHEAALKSILKI